MADLHTPPPTLPRRARDLFDRYTALAFVGYLLLSCMANAIVLLTFGSASNAHLPWNLQELHTQGWMMHALLSDPGSMAHVNYFYPMPYAIALSEPRVLLALLGLPAYLATGSNVAAFNLDFLLVGPLCCLGAFIACRAVTGHAVAAFVGGLMFGFAPFQIGHLYQAVLLHTMFVPVGLAAAWYLGRRPTVASALLLGLSGAAQMVACAHFATYLAYGAAGVLFCSLWVHRREHRLGRTGALLLLAGATAALASLWLVLPFYEGYKLSPQMDNDWKSMSGQNADLLSLLLPPVNTGPISAHSKWINTLLGTPGETLFPGFIAMALTLAWAAQKVWQGPQRERAAEQGPGRRPLRPLLVVLWWALLPAALFLVALVPKDVEKPGLLLMGTGLCLAVLATWLLLGFKLRLLAGFAALWRASSSLERVIMAGLLLVFLIAQGPVIYLLGQPLGFGPGFLTQEFFPGVKASRVPTRIWVLGAAGFAVLAALGYRELSARLSRLQSAALLLILCWGQLATYPHIEVIDLGKEVRERSYSEVELDGQGIPRIYSWLAQQPGKNPILSLPVGPYLDNDHAHNMVDRSIETLYMYFSLAHFQPIVGGVTSYYPNWYLYKLKNNYSVPFPDERSLEMFEKLGIKYAFFHKHFYVESAWQRVKAQIEQFPERLKLAREEGGVLAYQLTRAGAPSQKAVKALLSYQKRYQDKGE